MIRISVCVALHCDTCNQAFGWDDGESHFDTIAAARDAARNGGWILANDRATCPDCACAADCAATGHQWGNWHAGSTTRAGQPYRHRWCEHCSEPDYDPPFTALMAVDEAAQVVTAALESDQGGAG